MYLLACLCMWFIYYAQEWDCWVVECMFIKFHKEWPHCFLNVYSTRGLLCKSWCHLRHDQVARNKPPLFLDLSKSVCCLFPFPKRGLSQKGGCCALCWWWEACGLVMTTLKNCIPWCVPSFGSLSILNVKILTQIILVKKGSFWPTIQRRVEWRNHRRIAAFGSKNFRGWKGSKAFSSPVLATFHMMLSHCRPAFSTWWKTVAAGRFSVLCHKILSPERDHLCHSDSCIKS